MSRIKEQKRGYYSDPNLKQPFTRQKKAGHFHKNFGLDLVTLSSFAKNKGLFRITSL